MAFWQAKCGVKDAESGKEAISAGYFRSIRNYYRFGWVIPYLFGASPAICSSFLQGKPTTLPLRKRATACITCRMPPLRLSDLGYTNKSQSNLGITFNDLHEYVAGLKRAIKTPSEEYAKIGLQKDGSICRSTATFCRLKMNFMRRSARNASPVGAKPVRCAVARWY